MSRSLWLATLAATLLVVAGCGDEAVESPAPAVPVTPTPAAPPVLNAPVAPAPPAEPSRAEEQSEPKPKTDEQADYQPPYPERTELFIPPDRDPIAATGDGDATEDRVQLKGFVNVDGQKVILSIDGDIAPLAEGGERHGVKVVAINPPKVILEYGSAKWTASLE